MALQFGGNRATAQGTTRNDADGQIQQVAIQHW